MSQNLYDLTCSCCPSRSISDVTFSSRISVLASRTLTVYTGAPSLARPAWRPTPQGTPFALKCRLEFPSWPPSHYRSYIQRPSLQPSSSSCLPERVRWSGEGPVRSPSFLRPIHLPAAALIRSAKAAWLSHDVHRCHHRRVDGFVSARCFQAQQGSTSFNRMAASV